MWVSERLLNQAFLQEVLLGGLLGELRSGLAFRRDSRGLTLG